MTLTVSTRITRPQFMENFKAMLEDSRETTRVCAEDGCENAARHIKGYYLVDERRVRVWVCAEHTVGTTNNVLPTPRSIQIALDTERKFQQERARKVQWSDSHERVSVRELSSTGSGKVIPFDRVANFRWEPAPGSLKGKKKGRANASS